jgi:hypothetical protein
MVYQGVFTGSDFQRVVQMTVVNFNIKKMVSTLKTDIEGLEVDDEQRKECYDKLKCLKKNLEAEVNHFMLFCNLAAAKDNLELDNTKSVKEWLGEECEDLLDDQTKFW